MVQIRGQRVYTSPNMTIHFDMDYDGIARYAMQSTELGAVLHTRAAATTAYARSISPYEPHDARKAGRPHYRDSWQHLPYIERRVGDPPLGQMPRQAQLIYNDSPQALAVEFGNGQGTSYESLYGHRIFAKIVDYLEGHIG
jgi:hypothetical protein